MNASEVRPGHVSARDHVRGANDALVTIIEYGDFECPSCKQAAPAVALLLKRFEGRVRLIFRHFPLEAVYPNAVAAAEASEAAASQGRFWEMHDQLLENQRHLEVACLAELAQRLGLDVRRFSNELKDHLHVPRIRRSAAEGRRLGIRASPTFYVNGSLCDVSFGLLALRHAVEQKLCGARNPFQSASDRTLGHGSE